MGFFDLHCDTLYRALQSNGSIYENDYHLSIKRGNKLLPWIQCFAIFIPDKLRKNKALTLVKDAYKLLINEIKDNQEQIYFCKTKDDIVKSKELKKCGVIFTIEGGGALGGNIENLDLFKNMGVKVITLTWNGRCEIGDGIEVFNSKGITDFGRLAIKKMEELDIVVDISHASEKLFFDVAAIASKPIIATHSNSKTICKHKRNLTDEQFKIIKSLGGIVGLNFSNKFLNNDPQSSTIEDIILNAEYFLSLGGEKNICIGSDFDGTDMPKGISGIESIVDVAECFLKHNYKESLVNDILFQNAYNFFAK